MKLIINILVLFLCTHLIQATTIPKQSLSLLIRDQDTGKIIYDNPLQATYGGFFTSSNHNGEIVLPRKTQVLDFYVLIANQIKPVLNILNNVSYLQIPTGTLATMYHITTEINPLTDKAEWLTTVTEIPEDQQVPLHTIIIFADPSNVSMQTGLSKIKLDSHLILPNLYLKEPLINQTLALLLPNMRPFLGKLETAYALTPYGYATIQTR